MIKRLSNITLDVKGVKNMKKNAKKKKGFTLVELIAVIAILGILAAVIVPKVSSYTTQASAARTKSDAATVLNAIEVYNASADGTTYLKISTDTTNNMTVTDLKSVATPSASNFGASAILTQDPAKSLLDTLKKLPTTSPVLSSKIDELQNLSLTATQ